MNHLSNHVTQLTEKKNARLTHYTQYKFSVDSVQAWWVALVSFRKNPVEKKKIIRKLAQFCSPKLIGYFFSSPATEDH